MDAANAPPSLTLAPLESNKKTKSKEITEHQLDVVVVQDFYARLSKLPRKRDFVGPDYEVPPMTFRLPMKSEATNYFFTPRVVSIGPCHHGKRCLAEMERHKSRFLEDFLSRDTSRSLEHYQNELKKRLEQSLKNDYCYDLTGFDLTRNELVDIMILDGCFILEFLMKIYNRTPDEIFQNKTLLRYIKTDLLMFENQVPLFVLNMLYQHPVPSIGELLGYYFWGNKKITSAMFDDYWNPRSLLQSYTQLFILPRYNNGNVKHVYPTGIYAEVHRRVSSRRPARYLSGLAQAPSAERLKKAGVVFKPKRSANFLDITFHEGVLNIPVLSMDEPFLLFLVNLSMFDLYVNRPSVMKSYYRFMACLLQNSNDFSILRKHGIIEGNFMNDQDLHYLFHRFGNPDHLLPAGHYFENLFDELLLFRLEPKKKRCDILKSRIVTCIKDKTECLWQLFRPVMVFLVYVLFYVLLAGILVSAIGSMVLTFRSS